MSWPDTRQPGVRHWASRSIYYRYPWFIAMAWYLFVLPFIVFPVWASLQFYVWAGCWLMGAGEWIWRSHQSGRWLPFHVEHHRHMTFWWPVWEIEP